MLDSEMFFMALTRLPTSMIIKYRSQFLAYWIFYSRASFTLLSSKALLVNSRFKSSSNTKSKSRFVAKSTKAGSTSAVDRLRSASKNLLQKTRDYWAASSSKLIPYSY
jgi:hypothetical protein